MVILEKGKITGKPKTDEAAPNFFKKQSMKTFLLKKINGGYRV